MECVGSADSRCAMSNGDGWLRQIAAPDHGTHPHADGAECCRVRAQNIDVHFLSFDERSHLLEPTETSNTQPSSKWHDTHKHRVVLATMCHIFRLALELTRGLPGLCRTVRRALAGVDGLAGLDGLGVFQPIDSFVESHNFFSRSFVFGGDLSGTASLSNISRLWMNLQTHSITTGWLFT